MWTDQPIQEVLSILETKETGLTNDEVLARQEKDGKNVLPKGKKLGVLKTILNQFKSAIMLILFIAIAFSLIIGEYSNVIFIGAVVVINVILGFIQEYTAGKSAEKLQQQISVKSQVLRNGEIISVDASELVVGDIVLLESGNKIPADMRLIETVNFKVDESILSGESEGRTKDCLIGEKFTTIMDANNMVFAGTVVLSGRAKGVVVSIGVNTEFGKISEKVLNMKEAPSPLVIRINKFVKQISLVFAILVLCLTVILYFKGYALKDILFSVIALTVSAIPEGLSTAVTISLSLSSSRMAKKNVIVKNLNSVESLGSCTVIASDKTGTLTVNEQTAKVIILPNKRKIDVTGNGYDVAGVIDFNNKNENEKYQIDLIANLGYLNNESQVRYDGNAYDFLGDSIDIAFKVLGIKNGVNEEDIKITNKIPYESENRYSALQYVKDDVEYLTIKGSCETILKHCKYMMVDGKNEQIDKELIMNQNENMSAQGYRIIALAYGKSDEKLSSDIENVRNLVFLGLVAFIDPAREETIPAVKFCQDSGIKVYMITGDHPLTAYSIGKKLNIATSKSQVTTGEEIEKVMAKGNDEFDKFIKNIRICARVTPMQKLAIVSSLRRQGEFVAVTGDGINDTLALKEANIGIAVGSGTDIAKESADMIISDDKFSSIVTGVKEGRMAYSNIRNVIYLLLSTGLCEVILYCLSILFNLTFPLTAVQFLWLNLITNGIQSNAFAFEKTIPHVSDSRARSTKENIFNRLLISEILVSATFMGLVSFIIYYSLSQTSMNIAEIRTVMLTLMIFFEDIQVLNCRNEYLSVFRVPFHNNWLVISTVLLSFVVQSIFLCIPAIVAVLDMGSISAITVLELFALSLSIIAVMEIFKLVLAKINSKKFSHSPSLDS